MTVSGSSSYTGRYAPSPTGALHMGNLRTALLAWLHARLRGGRFIVRMDDLDGPRNRPGCAEQILQDLRWLGLDWDEGPDTPGLSGPYVQSCRSKNYQQAFDQLLRQGNLFPCFCSRKDIALALSAPHQESAVGVYPGTCRSRAPLGLADEFTGEAAWRFRVKPGLVSFADGLCGRQQQDLCAEVGDFVVRRRDGLFAYQLATVVDDISMAVTDVVRGDDLLCSTPRQIALFRALGHEPPGFWHVALMRDAAGERLAKRDGSDSLATWIDAGHSASSVVGVLASSCGLLKTGLKLTPQELLGELSVEDFARALSPPLQNGQSGES